MPKTLQKSSARTQNPETHNSGPSISLYEQSREERIKENLQRLQKLGILDLSQQLKKPSSQRDTPKLSPKPSTKRLSEPVRRSSRLQNVTPPIYSEVLLIKKQRLGLQLEHKPVHWQDEDVMVMEGEGSKQEEVDTEEEHKKVSRNTKRSRTLSVDERGEDGRRIDNQVKQKANSCQHCNGAKSSSGPRGLNQVYGVSPQLRAVVGEPALSRIEITKRLWEYIRENNLQNPSDKRNVICDDALRIVFETDSTDMFTMQKMLSKHLIHVCPCQIPILCQGNASISQYERSREERIKDNCQRMQKLGIFDLSQKLNLS